jgi:hypothetical protein
MAHYVKVVEEVVVKGMEADESFFNAFVDTSPGRWLITYKDANGEPAKRYHFAGVGYLYDISGDAFYAPKPYPSWTLNKTTYIWDCPLPYPSGEGAYVWDEDVYQADHSQGWVLVE